MKVRELIKSLEKLDPELEVTITDGYDCSCYHTRGIIISLFCDNNVVVDIGIGGCKEENYGTKL
jgi:hypothetical protein